jgi:hypothetical protein
MAKKPRRPLTPAEISGQHAAELPRREALSLVFGSVTLPAGAVAAAASSQTAAEASTEAEQVAEAIQES